MLHQRTARRPSTDAGFTLIEVVVAMVVFGLLATGIVSGVMITLKMTPDTEAREVAANLAAQEIDLVRAIGDPYQVGQRTTTQTINGRVFTIDRETDWVSSAGTANVCGSATTNFELQVNVSVSWSDQSKNTQNVRSDTLLAPVSTLTDAKTGAMAIYVVDADNSPQAGVAVSVAPYAANPAGAVTPSRQPAATGSDGCTYLGKLTPGNYLVTITRLGSVDLAGNSAPSHVVAVAAGATTTYQFPPYEGSATLVPQDADNTDGSASVPNDLVRTYLTSGTMTSSSAAKVTVTVNKVGYTAVAGRLGSGTTTTCAEFDPAAWGAGLSNGKAVGSGSREAAVAPKNGTSRPIGVPMGVVTLQGVAGTWVRAVQTTPGGTGNPGCASLSTTVHFDQVTADQTEFALPYGTWALFTGTDAGTQTTPVAATQFVSTSNVRGGGVDASGVVTLDPRPLP